MIPFRLAFQPGVSLCDQVVYAVKRAVVAGKMRPGDPFPSVRTLSKELKINPNTAHKAVAQLVRRDGGMIGIGGGLLDVEPELELIHVGDVEMIPVAALNHPLARGRPNASGAARNHRQLVLTVRTPFSEGPDLGIFSADVWRLADLGAKHALLVAGVGWGNMPEPHVRADLAAGRLVRLELPEARNALYPLRALHRADEPPGPAAAWLIQRFVDQVSAF